MPVSNPIAASVRLASTIMVGASLLAILGCSQPSAHIHGDKIWSDRSVRYLARYRSEIGAVALQDPAIRAALHRAEQLDLYCLWYPLLGPGSTREFGPTPIVSIAPYFSGRDDICRALDDVWKLLLEAATRGTWRTPSTMDRSYWDNMAVSAMFEVTLLMTNPRKEEEGAPGHNYPVRLGVFYYWAEGPGIPEGGPETLRVGLFDEFNVDYVLQFSMEDTKLLVKRLDTLLRLAEQG